MLAGPRLSCSLLALIVLTAAAGCGTIATPGIPEPIPPLCGGSNCGTPVFRESVTFTLKVRTLPWDATGAVQDVNDLLIDVGGAAALSLVANANCTLSGGADGLACSTSVSAVLTNTSSMLTHDFFLPRIYSASHADQWQPVVTALPLNWTQNQAVVGVAGSGNPTTFLCSRAGLAQLLGWSGTSEASITAHGAILGVVLRSDGSLVAGASLRLVDLNTYIIGEADDQHPPLETGLVNLVYADATFTGSATSGPIFLATPNAAALEGLDIGWVAVDPLSSAFSSGVQSLAFSAGNLTVLVFML